MRRPPVWQPCPALWPVQIDALQPAGGRLACHTHWLASCLLCLPAEDDEAFEWSDAEEEEEEEEDEAPQKGKKKAGVLRMGTCPAYAPRAACPPPPVRGCPLRLPACHGPPFWDKCQPPLPAFSLPAPAAVPDFDQRQVFRGRDSDAYVSEFPIATTQR